MGVGGWGNVLPTPNPYPLRQDCDDACIRRNRLIARIHIEPQPLDAGRPGHHALDAGAAPIPPLLRRADRAVACPRRPIRASGYFTNLTVRPALLSASSGSRMALPGSITTRIWYEPSGVAEGRSCS